MAQGKKNRDILNIFIVLGTAVAFAAILSAVFLYYHSPSGRYLAANTLLDPAIIGQIRYPDRKNGGKKFRFEFDPIEFSYYSDEKGKMLHLPVSIETYRLFYSKVGSEKSLRKVTSKVQGLFQTAHLSYLTIAMRKVEGSETASKNIFQVIEFIREDYFRVQLLGEKGGWAYFFRPGLYLDMISLFTEAHPELHQSRAP